MKTYVAQVRRQDGEFVLDIPEMDGILLQAKNMEEAESFSRRMVAEFEEVDESEVRIRFVFEEAIAK